MYLITKITDFKDAASVIIGEKNRTTGFRMCFVFLSDVSRTLLNLPDEFYDDLDAFLDKHLPL